MRHYQEKNKDRLFVLRRDSGVHHRWYRGASLCGHQTATHWSLKVELSSTTAPAVSKMVTSTNHLREAAIASGSSTTRLLGTFQVTIANSWLHEDIEYLIDLTYWVQLNSTIFFNRTLSIFSLFQGVEHVFIVGVGGGVPHYTDWGRHVSCCLVDDL